MITHALASVVKIQFTWVSMLWTLNPISMWHLSFLVSILSYKVARISLKYHDHVNEGPHSSWYISQFSHHFFIQNFFQCHSTALQFSRFHRSFIQLHNYWVRSQTCRICEFDPGTPFASTEPYAFTLLNCTPRVEWYMANYIMHS